MKAIFLENFSLKLIALVLSLVLFLVVRGEDRTTTSVDLPVVVQIPDGYVVVNEPVHTVTVRLEGSWGNLKEVRAEELGPISIRPSVGDGKTTHTLQDDTLTLPSDVGVLTFDPPTIVVELEKSGERTVPVAVERSLSGAPPPGYLLGEVRANPKEVKISGPRSVVDNVSKVFVEPIDITGRTTNIVEERHVVPDRRGIEVVNDPVVTVEIDVVAKSRELTLESVPVRILDLARPHDFLPETVTIVVVGEKEALQRVDPDSVYVAIRPSEEESEPARTSQLEITAKTVFNLPPGVGIDSERTSSVVLMMKPSEPPAPVPALGPEGLPMDGEPNDPNAPKPDDAVEGGEPTLLPQEPAVASPDTPVP